MLARLTAAHRAAVNFLLTVCLMNEIINDTDTHAGRWRALALLALAELLGMSLWFSAAAVVPVLQGEWQLNTQRAGWLTLAVQLGFVAGTLLSALVNLPDVVSTRRLFAVAAALGAL